MDDYALCIRHAVPSCVCCAVTIGTVWDLVTFWFRGGRVYRLFPSPSHPKVCVCGGGGEGSVVRFVTDEFVP